MFPPLRLFGSTYSPTAVFTAVTNVKALTRVLRAASLPHHICRRRTPQETPTSPLSFLLHSTQSRPLTHPLSGRQPQTKKERGNHTSISQNPLQICSPRARGPQHSTPARASSTHAAHLPRTSVRRCPCFIGMHHQPRVSTSTKAWASHHPSMPRLSKTMRLLSASPSSPSTTTTPRPHGARRSAQAFLPTSHSSKVAHSRLLLSSSASRPPSKRSRARFTRPTSLRLQSRMPKPTVMPSPLSRKSVDATANVTLTHALPRGTARPRVIISPCPIACSMSTALRRSSNGQKPLVVNPHTSSLKPSRAASATRHLPATTT